MGAAAVPAAMIGGSIISGAMSGGGGGGNSVTIDPSQSVALAKQAGDSQIDYLRQALGFLSASNNSSQYQATNGVLNSRAPTRPYSTSGYNALDALNVSLGLSTPKGGSAAQAEAGNAEISANALMEANKNSFHATLDKMIKAGRLNQSQINTIKQYQSGLDKNYRQPVADILGSLDQNDGDVQSLIRDFQGENQAVDAMYAARAASNPEQVASTPQQGLSAFFNTPGYQLTNGSTGVAVDPNAQPMDRFAASPIAKALLGPNYNPNAGLGENFGKSDLANFVGGYDPNKSIQEQFKASPDYQFRLDEGKRALERSAAAKGLLESGAFAKELQNYGQNTASGEFNNYQNKLQTSFDTYGNILGTSLSNYLGGLQSQFSNYQNQLGALSGQGANIASQQQQNLAQVLGIQLPNQTYDFGKSGAQLFSNMGDASANSLLAQAGLYSSAQNANANFAAAQNGQRSAQQSGALSNLFKTGGNILGGQLFGNGGALASTGIGTEQGGQLVSSLANVFGSRF